MELSKLRHAFFYQFLRPDNPYCHLRTFVEKVEKKGISPIQRKRAEQKSPFARWKQKRKKKKKKANKAEARYLTK